jgi:hypothetical protein
VILLAVTASLSDGTAATELKVKTKVQNRTEDKPTSPLRDPINLDGCSTTQSVRQSTPFVLPIRACIFPLPYLLAVSFTTHLSDVFNITNINRKLLYHSRLIKV